MNVNKYKGVWWRINVGEKVFKVRYRVMRIKYKYYIYIYIYNNFLNFRMDIKYKL